MLPLPLLRFVSSFMFLLVLQDFINLFQSSLNCLIIGDTSDSPVSSSLSKINFLSPLMVNAFCPSNCRCDDIKLEAVCSNATLTIIPITLNPNMRKIHLNFNQIVKLSTDSFSVYRNIEFLDLSYNKVDTLEDNSFRGLTKLKTLHLDGNRLNSLTNYTFNGLSGLEELYLNDNLLTNLNDSVFKGLTNLKQLNLNRNRLNYLGPRVFVGLNNLRTLYLISNSLNLVESTSLHDQVISTTSSLTTTSSTLTSTSTIAPLTSNQKFLLEALSPRYLPNLIKLHLGGNNLPTITRLNSPFFSGIISTVNSSLPVDSTMEPNDNQNDHHYSHERSKRREPLSTPSPITSTANNLRFWSNLQELSLEGCSISSIESGSFNGLSKLTTLRINNNNFQQVPKDIFTDLGKLEVLQIGGNPFTTINSTSFTTLTSLKSLDISRCPHLNNIESGAFIGLDKLEQLEISFNPNLNSIESTLFDPLVSLKGLILSHNSFAFLDPHLSLIANRIKLFDIRGNPFTCNCSVQWIRKLFLKNNSLTNGEVIIKGLQSSSPSSSSSSSTTTTTTESYKGTSESRNSLESSVKREMASALSFLPAAARRIAPSSSSSFSSSSSIETSSSSSSSSSSSVLHSSDSSDSTSYLNELIKVTCVSPMPLRGKQIIDLEPGDMGCYEVESMAPIVIGVFIGCLIVTGVVIICGIRWRSRLTGLIKGTTVAGTKSRSHHHDYSHHDHHQHYSHQSQYHYPAKIGASSMVPGMGTIGSVMGGVGGSGRKIFGMMSHNPIRTNDLDYGPYSKPECIVIPAYSMESTTIINNLNNPYEVVPLSGSLLRNNGGGLLGGGAGRHNSVDRISSIVGGLTSGFTGGTLIGNSLTGTGLRSNLSAGGVRGVGTGIGGGCGGSDSSSYEGEYHYPIVSNLRSTPITEL